MYLCMLYKLIASDIQVTEEQVTQLELGPIIGIDQSGLVRDFNEFKLVMNREGLDMDKIIEKLRSSPNDFHNLKLYVLF